MKRIRFHFVKLLLVLGNLAAIIPAISLGAPPLFPLEAIQYEPLILQNRGDQADVYFPAVSADQDAFQIVAVLQGALIDKKFYSIFASQLARFGFVVVVPNHFQILGPPVNPLALFTDQRVVNDVLAQMVLEDSNPDSPLFRIVDTTRLGLAGHSFGGVMGLFAIGGRCTPPFCFGVFQRPKALRAGAFYGTNAFDLTTGSFIDVNTNGIPVALLQGSRDGIATLAEAQTTFELLDGLRKLIVIDGANHFSITDDNNLPAIPPSVIPPVPDEVDPTISQTDAIDQIAWETGQFLSMHLQGELIPGDFPTVSTFSTTKLDVSNVVFVNGRKVLTGKTVGKSGIDIDGGRGIVSQFLPDLVPAIFPQKTSNVKINVATQNPPISNGTAVFFKKIEIEKNGFARFEGGGPFHIDKLMIKKQATLELAAGTYFVNELEMNMKDDGAHISIISEPVKLHIGKNFKVNAKESIMNKGRDVTGFTIFLHHGSKLNAKEVDVAGLIYDTKCKKVDVEKMTIRGAIIVDCEVKLKKDLDITYTEEDREAVNSTIITP